MTNRPSIRAAAVQLQPELGDVDANLDKARILVRQAFAAGAQWVVLPELFTTGITFDDRMLHGHRPLDGAPMQLLKELAAEGDATVGGSYLAESEGQVYNTFVLALPDGQVFTHDKDFPSGPIENAYYAGGEDAKFVCLLREKEVAVEEQSIPPRPDNNQDGVFSLGEIHVGVALCWEMIRRRTVARLEGKVDIILASSAWPSIDADVGFPGMSRGQVVELNATLLRMLNEAPRSLATMVGAPVVHANLVGPQRATRLIDQEAEVVTQFCGESRIVDSRGETVASRSRADGEGLVVADLFLEQATPLPVYESGFWIPELDPILKDLWYAQGALGRDYYLRTTRPFRQNIQG